MGTVLSVFRAAPGAPIGTTRESGGAESVVESAKPSAASSKMSAASSKMSAAGSKSGKEAKSTMQQQLEPEDWPPDNYGIEEYGPEVVVREWEGPQRIKESKLTAEQQKSFRDILGRVFSPDSIMGVKGVYSPEEVMSVTTTVIEYLKSEPTLIEDVPFGVSIVGDLHGQLYDLDRVFRGDAKDGKPGWECAKYVFLGDYVDRGRQSLEIVLGLYCIKMLYPDRIFLLRGNHEFTDINMKYGFYFEMKERYDEMPVKTPDNKKAPNKQTTADVLFKTINESFMWLSIAAIVGNIYYCAHAGISPGMTRYRMRGLYKPFHHSHEHIAVLDTTWCDPALGLQGAAFNKERGSSLYVGFDEVCYSLACMECVAVFRGHTMMKTGYDVAWNLMFTVFTATDYSYDENPGAVAVIDAQGKVGFRILEVDPERAEWERTIKKLEFAPRKKEEEEKTRNNEIEKNDGKLQEM